MGLVRAKTSFFMANNQLVSEGVLLDAEHPIAKRFGDHFETVDLAPSPGFDVVESATSAPGEKRSTVARNRKPADKADDDTEVSED